jgi:phosphoribosylamine--glycine ligase
MNILLVSDDLLAGNLGKILQDEGHQVKLFIADKGRRENFEGIVPKINSWKKELGWVGKEGLIIFDGCSYGAEQDDLRDRGYSVVGSSGGGDRLENERDFGSQIFTEHGLKTVPLINFKSIRAAIDYVKLNRKKWVIKQNTEVTTQRNFNYVGEMDNAEDVIEVLYNYKNETKYGKGAITLQEKIEGIEIGVGRYFNGIDWIGPIEINLEHKKYFPGNLGATSSEMGTVAWYDENENNKLFCEILSKLKPFLQKTNFRGDFEINCIVNETGAYPLEATSRFGSPIIHLQCEIQKSPWGEFLKAVADGKEYKLDWKRGYGLVVVATVPTTHPFPVSKSEVSISPKNLTVFFSDKAIKSNFEHIYFEEISKEKRNNQDRYYISDDRGYILYVANVNEDFKTAQEEAYKTLREDIFIPKMFYRNDIGDKFLKEDYQKLKDWGYITD